MAVGFSIDTAFTGNTTLRIALLGKVGSGKSSTANTILGREEFEVATGYSSNTQDVSIRTAFRNGRQIEVVDAPAIFDRSPSYSQSVQALMPFCRRPDTIILYTIRIGLRFTQEDVEAFMSCKGLFNKHLIMIGFTCGDMLECEGMSIEDYIQTLPTSLTRILEDCGRNYFVFKNVGLMSSRNEQAGQLLEIIESKLKSPSRSSLSHAAAGGDLERERKGLLYPCVSCGLAVRDLERERKGLLDHCGSFGLAVRDLEREKKGPLDHCVSCRLAGEDLERERKELLAQYDKTMALLCCVQ